MLHWFAKLALPAVATIPLLAAAPAWSQDEAEAPAPAEASGDAAAAGEEAQAEEAEAEAEAEDAGGGPAVGLDEIPELDEQTHEDDDDDFIPTEEIPVDQSIPFPTDI